MRGKVKSEKMDLVQFRITPAYAGKRMAQLRRFKKLQDHPRLCGEKNQIIAVCGIVVGSPPPMRGKVEHLKEHYWYSGITPAYAGKSRCVAAACVFREDHPRLCGEKIFLCFVIMGLIGSPPPMRGKAKKNAYTPIYSGITPAYAGKSQTTNLTRSTLRDHPRLCGEKVEG